MADVMTPDGILRVCGYLEAVWREDDEGMVSLLRHGPSEESTPALLAQFGELAMQMLLPAQFGIREGMPANDLAVAANAFQNDPTVQVSIVLCETLRAFAPTATPEQAEIIGRSLISYLASISEATEDEVLPLIDTMRQAALQRCASGPV